MVAQSRGPEMSMDYDGRTLRKTGRTRQLATRVTPEFYQNLRMAAARDSLKMVEVLERALESYEVSSAEDLCSQMRELWARADSDQRSRFLTEISDALSGGEQSR